MFYVEPQKSDGRWRNIRLDRLKDKLGTRELPTAEIHLEGTPAELVGEARHGVRQIAPMLGITRTWNAIGALATMRRCIALARDYANRRIVFGRPLAEQPLHQDTIAGMQAEFEAAFHLSFYVTELLGRAQMGQADEAQQNLLRLLTPLIKLWTGKLAVTIASETCECFGGAGYLEDSGIPQLLRDAQVWSIWEGTSNVQALDFLRAFRGNGGLQPLAECAAGDSFASAGAGTRSLCARWRANRRRSSPSGCRKRPAASANAWKPARATSRSGWRARSR